MKADFTDFVHAEKRGHPRFIFYSIRLQVTFPPRVIAARLWDNSCTVFRKAKFLYPHNFYNVFAV